MHICMCIFVHIIFFIFFIFLFFVLFCFKILFSRITITYYCNNNTVQQTFNIIYISNKQKIVYNYSSLFVAPYSSLSLSFSL